MRTLRLTIIILACASAIAAEAQTGILRKIDRLLDKRDMRADAKTDTTYVGRPEGRWTVKLRMNVSGTNILTRGLIGGGPFTTRLYADAKTTVGASVSYRGLSLGFSLNPAKLAGWNKDYELNFTSYGNRVGGDIYTKAADIAVTVSQTHIAASPAVFLDHCPQIIPTTSIFGYVFTSSKNVCVR